MTRIGRHPAACSARSRERSASKAAVVRWCAWLSSSAITFAPGARLDRLEQRPDHARAAPARVAREQVVEREAVGQPQRLRLGHRSAHARRRLHGGEVEDRAGHRSDRNAAQRRHLLGRDGSGVVEQSRVRLACPWDPHVDPRGARPEHGPPVRGRAVTQRGAWPGEQNRGHRPGVVAQRRVPGRIDAPVYPPQPLRREPVLDGHLAHAGGEELRAGHHVVLGRREIRDHPIGRRTPQFPLYYTGKDGVRGHAEHDGAPRQTRGLQA